MLKNSDKKILIADMCFHQVMAECMYNVFSLIGKTDILANESNMDWSEDIPQNNITVTYRPKGKVTPFMRRFYRLLFLFRLLRIKKRYSHIIVTTGIEYSLFGVRTLSYLLYYILCSSNTKIITVVHNTIFWEKNSKQSLIKKVILSGILNKSSAFACLSKRVLRRWKYSEMTLKPSIRLPFLTVAEKDIIKQKAELVNGKYVFAFQGLVNHKRKNYIEMAKAFDSVSSEKRAKYKIIFQGPPVYSEDRKFLESFSRIIECDWRDYFLSYDKMNKLLKQAHLFICPLELSYGYGDYKESGVGFDCIRYQKGAITKKGICSDEFDDILFTYRSTEELSSLLEELDVYKITKLNENVVNTSGMFTHNYWAQKMKKFTDIE